MKTITVGRLRAYLDGTYGAEDFHIVMPADFAVETEIDDLEQLFATLRRMGYVPIDFNECEVVEEDDGTQLIYLERLRRTATPTVNAKPVRDPKMARVCRAPSIRSQAAHR